MLKENTQLEQGCRYPLSTQTVIYVDRQGRWEMKVGPAGWRDGDVMFGGTTVDEQTARRIINKVVPREADFNNLAWMPYIGGQVSKEVQPTRPVRHIFWFKEQRVRILSLFQGGRNTRRLYTASMSGKTLPDMVGRIGGRAGAMNTILSLGTGWEVWKVTKTNAETDRIIANFNQSAQQDGFTLFEDNYQGDR